MACQDRNRNITNYRVTYYPSINPSDDEAVILGDEDGRVFTALQLPPRTNYTFRVQALDLRNLVLGVSTALIVSTSTPLSK